jgi:hypothetical protein
MQIVMIRTSGKNIVLRLPFLAPTYFFMLFVSIQACEMSTSKAFSLDNKILLFMVYPYI